MATAIRFNHIDEYHDTVVHRARQSALNDSTECPYCAGDFLVSRGNWSRHMAAHHADISEPYSYDETRILQAKESVIKAGIDMIKATGEALRDINERRLYRQYGSFANYLEQRWNISKSRGYQIIAAAGVLENLSTIVDIEATSINEAQARALAPLKPDEQRIVYEVVKQTAPKGKVTAAHIKSVATVLKEVATTQAIDDGSGEQISVHGLIKAAVTEETYERMKRQETHIEESRKRKEAKQAEQSAQASAPTYSVEARDGVFVAVMVIGEFATDKAAWKAIRNIKSKLEECA